MTIEQVEHLYYKDQRSDKEYHLELRGFSSNRLARFRVIAKFGPRDGTLTHVDKSKADQTWNDALALFTKTLNEKLAKGYQRQDDPLVEKLKKAIPAVYMLPNEWLRLAEAAKEYFEERA